MKEDNEFACSTVSILTAEAMENLERLDLLGD